MGFGVCGRKEYVIERLHRDYALLTQQDLSFQSWVHVAVRKARNGQAPIKLRAIHGRLGIRAFRV